MLPTRAPGFLRSLHAARGRMDAGCQACGALARGAPAMIGGRRPREVYRVYAEDDLLGGPGHDGLPAYDGFDGEPEQDLSPGACDEHDTRPGRCAGDGPLAGRGGTATHSPRERYGAAWRGRSRIGRGAPRRALVGTVLACALGLVAGFAAVELVRQLAGGGAASGAGAGADARARSAKQPAAGLGAQPGASRVAERVAPRVPGALRGARSRQVASGDRLHPGRGRNVRTHPGSRAGAEQMGAGGGLQLAREGQGAPSAVGPPAVAAPLPRVASGASGGREEFGFER